ncbi:MAG: hypothetical protein RL367_51 [Pseudomonadota bacterium]
MKPVIVTAVIALGFAATSAIAATPATTPHPVAARPFAAKPVMGRPLVAAHPVAAARPAAQGRMVRAKLANGQIVTYNCSLPGNAVKQACK